MNTLSLLFLLCVAVAAVLCAPREKRQGRTVIERTVINNYGGQGFNRQPWGYGGNQWGGFNRWGNPGPGFGFNRGPFGGPQPPTVVKTTVIRQG
ncbi:hypothetical protein OESDEN_00041 [Oesophagostomum dentatum]|uniref:Uncharacterized protein n=1 Tax=Oesophagostomum dentatum TaxID=61180 RepID=A0A0B1TR03_OESDE|nr:hypothetical protein OESDEN_00041 [Oesophagostomum dentatum]